MTDKLDRNKAMRLAVSRLRTSAGQVKSYERKIEPPKLLPGVVPNGASAPVLAMDSVRYDYAASMYPGGGFPGFPYLAQLSTRAEYRAFAQTLATEMTRKGVEFVSKQNDGDSSADKIKAIAAKFKELDIMGVMRRGVAHDCYYGRAQFFIDIRGADRSTPLILSPKTISKGSLRGVDTVDAVWTTPSMYNSLDPAAPDFYKPSSWFMLGQQVHASRLMTVITRELPDILKPAYNFAGMSLSQLAEPYVDNWLRTRQSVSDLINNFSITVLATSMDQVLQDGDGDDVFARADLFTATRSNRGLMMVDKEREDLLQVNTPLSGLHELQAQSQEHLCSVTRQPAIVQLGISPTGLNASSEGELRVWEDWVSANQEYYRFWLETVMKVVQLSLFGEIDQDIELKFVPLRQMTPKEQSEIRTADAQAASTYVAAGILDPMEIREKLARDPDSGYNGLDTSIQIEPVDPMGEDPPEDEGEEPKKDAFAKDEFREEDHPRAENGQFGEGGKKSKSGLMENATSQEIKDAAEDLTNRLKEHGFNVDLQHSGSAAGASSYLKIVDPKTGRFFSKDVRISGHSKGVFNSQGVWNVSPDHFDDVISEAIEMRNKGESEGAKLIREKNEAVAKKQEAKISSIKDKIKNKVPLSNSERKIYETINRAAKEDGETA